MADQDTTSTFAVFWLYKTLPQWLQTEQPFRPALYNEFAEVIEASSGSLTLRGAYSLAGLRHDADLMLWLHGPDLDAAHTLSVRLRKTGLGAYLQSAYTYTGMVPKSKYAPEHRPAFTKGVPPRAYLSMYPFVKTHEWYRLPFEARRALMAEHGRLGQPHSALPEVRIETAVSVGSAATAVLEAPIAAPTGSILTNTINSFGLGDQEFVVAFESDDPAALVKMVEDLRAAEVRLYTAIDTPIFLGRRKPLREALSDLG
jgi:chlorite dismutase